MQRARRSRAISCKKGPTDERVRSFQRRSFGIFRQRPLCGVSGHAGGGGVSAARRPQVDKLLNHAQENLCGMMLRRELIAGRQKEEAGSGCARPASEYSAKFGQRSSSGATFLEEKDGLRLDKSTTGQELNWSLIYGDAEKYRCKTFQKSTPSHHPATIFLRNDLASLSTLRLMVDSCTPTMRATSASVRPSR